MNRQKSFNDRGSSKIPTLNNRDSRRSRSLTRPSVASTGQRLRSGSTSGRNSRSVKQTPNVIRVPSTATRARSRELMQKKKEQRPLTDRAWNSKVLKRIQNYLVENDLTRDASDLRCGRLTLKLFVSVVNVLISDICKSEITLTNYVDRLPKVLTSIRYPVTVSNSVLKTANTQHSWPHIIGILSFLVDYHSILFGETLEDSVKEEESRSEEEIIRDLKVKTLDNAHTSFNNTESCDKDKQEFVKEIDKLFEVCYGSHQRLKEKQMSLDKQLKKQKEKNDGQRQQKENIKHDIRNMEQRTLDTGEKIESTRKDEIEFKKQISAQEIEIEKLVKAKAELEAENEEPAEHSRQAAQELKDQISATTNELSLIQSEIESKLQLSDELDIRLSAFIASLKDTIQKHNLLLMEPSLNMPELEEFKIQTNVRLKEADVTEIYERCKLFAQNQRLKMDNLEAALAAAKNIYEKEHQKKTLNEQEQQLSNELKSKKLAEKEQLEEHIADIIKSMTQSIKQLKEKLCQFSNNVPPVETRRKETAELREQCSQVEAKLEALEERMLKFFSGVSKVIVDELQEVNEWALRIAQDFENSLKPFKEYELM